MKRFITTLAWILVIVGGLNWGLWGFFQFDLVAWLFGGNTTGLSRVIYSIIGLAGLWCVASFNECCKTAKPPVCAGCGRTGQKGIFMCSACEVASGKKEG